MSKDLIKIFARALVSAVEAYAKSTDNKIDDKAVELIIEVLKQYDLI